MPRRKWPIIVMLLLCLVGCSRKEAPAQNALDFRTALTQAQGCSFVAEVRADYGEKLYDFTLEATYTPEETTLTVTAPQAIAGISAVVTNDGAKLKFDGMELDFGELANGYVSPVSVPWLLGQCWLEEYISAAGSDGDLERVSYLRGYDDEELNVDTWFSKGGIPVYAEVLYGDTRCLTIQIKDFEM